MKKIIVLGAGLVGKAMAIDLSKNFDVTSADVNLDALNSVALQAIKTLQVDFTDLQLFKSSDSAVRLSNRRCSGIFGLSNGPSCH